MIDSGRESLHQWLHEPAGRRLLDAETDLIEMALSNLFGYHIAQVGRLGGADLLSQSRILHQLVVEVDGDPRIAQMPGLVGPDSVGPRRTVLRGRATDLPLDTDSVDVLLLPHLLEFERDAHEALRECLRVIVPEGHVVICGFNPWSFFGLWRMVRRRGGAAPWNGNFVRLERLKDWLAVLGLDLTSVQGCFFRPPVRREGVLNALGKARLEFVRRRAIGAGAYVVVARKRVTRLTPIRTRWRPRRRLAAVSLAGPTARDTVARDSSPVDANGS